MITKSRIFLALFVCSIAFVSCEPEALPVEDQTTNISTDIDPVATGNEQNDEDHRGED